MPCTKSGAARPQTGKLDLAIKKQKENNLMSFFEITAFADNAASGAAAGTQQGGAMSMVTMLLPMAVIIVLMYFVLIRPQKKREKENKAMIDAMKVGDKVVTIGGICGKVIKIKDEYVFIESGNIGTANEKSVLKMERDSIKTVVQKIKN